MIPQPDARCRNTVIDDAERGSDQLRWAMRREFMGFARKHGVSFRDAKLLLMNGVSL